LCLFCSFAFFEFSFSRWAFSSCFLFVFQRVCSFFSLTWLGMTEGPQLFSECVSFFLASAVNWFRGFFYPPVFGVSFSILPLFFDLLTFPFYGLLPGLATSSVNKERKPQLFSPGYALLFLPLGPSCLVFCSPACGFHSAHNPPPPPNLPFFFRCQVVFVGCWTLLVFFVPAPPTHLKVYWGPLAFVPCLRVLGSLL